MTRLRHPALLLAAGILATGLLSACKDKPAPGTTPVIAAQNDPHARQQAELEAIALEMGQFVTVRLTDGSTQFDASPVAPALVSEAKVGGETPKTLFRVNKAGDTLILFSRDIFNARSFRTEIRLQELADKKSFTFQVVQPDGSLKERQFQLVRIARPE